MGGSNGNSGDISDVNFFNTQRNDIPNQPPSNMHREAYNDYQPATMPGRGGSAQYDSVPGGDRRYVTVRDGQNVIYAEPGSTVIINEGDHCRRVGDGRGPNGFYPNYDDTMAQVYASRRAQFDMQTGYRPDCQFYPQSNPWAYRNINAGGWEVPPPYMPRPNTGFFGIHIGGRHSGFSIGFGTPNYGYEPEWNCRPNYYNYANAGYYNSSMYDTPAYYGNRGYYGNSGLSLNFNFGGRRRC